MREFISTTCLGREVRLLWKPELKEIQAYISDGFIPIELAEGGESFVDFRCLDHHNDYSHLPSACVSALKYYGNISNPAKLMVNHTDIDCVLAGITLMGLLPLGVMVELNQEAGFLDTDPFGADISRMRYGDLISLWKTSMSSNKQSGWSWVFGLLLLVDMFRNASDYRDAIQRTHEAERERRRIATDDYENARRSQSGRMLLVAPSRVPGFDVQFARQPEFAAESPQGWRHWCIVAFAEASESVTISCPNKAVAEEIFGDGGLLNIFPKLPSLCGRGWGGRESVGGSPRGVSFPRGLLGTVLDTLENNLLKKGSMTTL
jgi:hypothetical protein